MKYSEYKTLAFISKMHLAKNKLIISGFLFQIIIYNTWFKHYIICKLFLLNCHLLSISIVSLLYFIFLFIYILIITMYSFCIPAVAFSLDPPNPSKSPLLSNKLHARVLWLVWLWPPCNVSGTGEACSRWVVLDAVYWTTCCAIWGALGKII